MLPQAVRFLAGDWSGEGPLDLSRLLVVVPTRQSGRRLREALANHAAERNAAVFPPRVMLPESLVTPDANIGVASPLDAVLAWAEVLRAVPLNEFRRVIPVDPPARDVVWSLRLALEFVRLQRALAESGLRLRDVVARLGDTFSETERWQQIAELERLQAETLQRFDLVAAPEARIAQAAAPVLPDGVERIVVLGAPDPQPLALSALAHHAATISVDVVIFASGNDAEAFDEWGRPRPDVWKTRTLLLPEFEQRVHLCADPDAQAQRAAASARAYQDPEGVLALGVGDSEVLPQLESALEQAGLAAFNPEGRRRRGDRLDQLLNALAMLTREESFAAVETLARCPDFLEHLERRFGADFSAARFLSDLDRLRARYLPATLSEALRHAPGSRELGEVRALRDKLVGAIFPASAVAALAMVFGGREFTLVEAADVRAAESAEAWMGVVRGIEESAQRFGGLSAGDWWDVALRLYGEGVRYEDKPTGALELQGWLELLWEDAPHLVVAGMNDGRVPEAVVGDPFLPESLRERLGLKSNEARFARDAYVLQALAESRKTEGRLDLLVGKTSSSGDPLRPSRLLLRCEDRELPQRVSFLFQPADATRANLAWRRAWQLDPRIVPPPPRVAVTGLRRWLECPFRFYLSRVLRMEAVDPAKSELDVFDFGTLCHSALEAMGRDARLRDCVEARVLRDFLLTTLEAEAARRFGTELSLPLIVQVESARQRLSRAAEIQAQTRAEGWVITEVERPFEIEIGGLTITGKIDRIDRHERTGDWRVLDYKTSDKAVDPEQAHLRGLRREEHAPEFARFVLNARAYVWADLQLPLYRRALAADGPIDCGYFNLPKAASETSIRAWMDYTRAHDELAWRCAEGIASAIARGEFWPPNEAIRADRDEFAPLFHHGAADSVRWREES